MLQIQMPRKQATRDECIQAGWIRARIVPIRSFERDVFFLPPLKTEVGGYVSACAPRASPENSLTHNCERRYRPVKFSFARTAAEDAAREAVLEGSMAALLSDAVWSLQRYP